MAFTKTPGLARLVGGESDPGLTARGVDADVGVVEAAAALRDLAVGRARVDAVVEAEAGVPAQLEIGVPFFARPAPAYEVAYA